jgi:glycosyltransferase involved in cell wall biosynthesis
MSLKTPKISIACPVYDMPNGDFFMKRLIKSLEQQTFTDFELVITQEGKMAENTNAAIKKSRGELIKILYMDDYLAHPDALKNIVDNFAGRWLVTGCNHDNGIEIFNPHIPYWNPEMVKGANTIGSPSVLTIKNEDPLLFDETMTWLLDCHYYNQMYQKYGVPIFLNSIDVTIGLGPHQMTNILTEEEKERERNYLANIYDKNFFNTK